MLPGCFFWKGNLDVIIFSCFSWPFPPTSTQKKNKNFPPRMAQDQLCRVSRRAFLRVLGWIFWRSNRTSTGGLVRCQRISKITSWWIFSAHPFWRSSNWDHLFRSWGENKQCLKPLPSYTSLKSIDSCFPS